jgi:acyl carrier protein
MPDKDFLIALISRVRPESSPYLENIDDETDLLEEGILDSISFLDLLLEIENTTGRQIDFTGLQPNIVACVRTLSGMLSKRGDLFE